MGRRFGLVLAVVAALASAGCSSSVAGIPEAASPPSVAGRSSGACGLLTSAELASIIGVPGAYLAINQRPDQNGRPVWGCIWSAKKATGSGISLQELTEAGFTQVSTDPEMTVTPLTGIGSQSFMLTDQNTDGRDPFVYFAAGDHYYVVSTTVAGHPPQDPANGSAEQKLAKILASRLSH